jgi:hypothetical protein
MIAESDYEPVLGNQYCIFHNGFDRAGCELERMLSRKATFPVIIPRQSRGL